MDPSPIEVVLFDRDGTLIEDVPYNGDPDKVVPNPGAIHAVALARIRGLRTGVVTNQSGIARGDLERDDVEAVNRRVDELFGLFETWGICPHGPDEGCGCRKPAPGLVIEAAARFGVDPRRMVVVGDRSADIGAATAAGAVAVLVPSERTEPGAEIGADHVLRGLSDLDALLDHLLGPTA
jgi:histidinol-phosphate phosphatase family protein